MSSITEQVDYAGITPETLRAMPDETLLALNSAFAADWIKHQGGAELPSGLSPDEFMARFGMLVLEFERRNVERPRASGIDEAYAKTKKDLAEAFHLRGVHYIIAPEQGACPSRYPEKMRSPDGVLKCYTAPAAAALRRSRMSESGTKFGARIREEMKKRGMSIGKLVEATSMSRATIAAVVHENVFFPHDACVKAIARAFKMPSEILFNLRDNPLKEAEHDDAPVNKRGMDVGATLKAVQDQGRKFTQEEANFQERSPSPELVCGNCRFYLRAAEGEVGECQVVDGPIPWFATSDLYISSEAEARAAFGRNLENPR